MASRGSIIQTLTPVYAQKTLRLRETVTSMKDNVETKVQERVDEFKEKYKNASDDELQSFIDNAFGDVEKEVHDQLAAMKEEVKSYAPKKPEKKQGMSDAAYNDAMKEYEKERSQFMDYVGFVVGFLKGLGNLFKEIFNHIREFFKSLWNWIKNALKNIAKKVADFITFVGEKIASGLAALFG